MLTERVHILVDRSRDSAWSEALIDLEPDDIYKVTDNMDHLSWPVLRNYDVLTICGYTTLSYKEDELQAIEEFVKLGGGLLLASSTSKFERDVGKPISEMQFNKVASIFGAEFMPLDACKGELETDDNLTRGYTGDNFWLADRAIFSYIDLCDIPFSNCGIISVSEGADVVIRHKTTMEAIGACTNYGEGRVLIVNDTTFAQRSRKVCRSFIDWLARNRFSKVSGDENIPDEIPVEEYTTECDNIKITYNKFVVKERVDTCLRFAKRIYEYLSNIFPDELKQTWSIKLTPSCTHETIEYYYHQVNPVSKGAYMSDHNLAYILMCDRMMRIRIFRDLASNVFSRDAFMKYSGITGMRLLGYEQEADRMYFEIIKQLKEKDPTGTEFDISKYYNYHPKAVWVLTTLTDKYGYDLFARMSKNIPKLQELWSDTPSYIPRQVFSVMDTFIHYLSLTVGEDMYPWFSKIGTTVHPLPMHEDDINEFKNGIQQYLKDMIRDKSLSTSEREDAIHGLIYIYDKINIQNFEIYDKYDCILWAIRLSHSCDSRAKKNLRELAYPSNKVSENPLNSLFKGECNSPHFERKIKGDLNAKEDIALSAIASLELVKLGDMSVVNRLIEIAKSLDYRFQLNVSNALRRIGYEFSINDENKPVVSTEVEYDGVRLRVYPTIEEQRVGNVFSTVSYCYHFPGGTHVTGAYIDSVRTLYKYRRMGLSSEAMRQILAHPAIRQCSFVALSTKVENPAHAIYKSFGFVDMPLGEPFYIELKYEKLDIPEGLVIRAYSQGDEIKMAELANQFYSDSMNASRIKARKYRGAIKVTKIAEKDGEMLGYVFAPLPMTVGQDEVELMDICLKNMNDLKSVGTLLLRSLHNDLLSQGFKRLMFWNSLANKEDVKRMLNELGYYSRPIGGLVSMFKIINLPMLLEEITPLLLKRLVNSDYKDWQGKIGISSKQHRATVAIENGEIGISEELLNDMDIILIADDDTITEMIIGRATPFDAYLQRRMTIKPIANDKVIRLLKQLFPKM